MRDAVCNDKGTNCKVIRKECVWSGGGDCTGWEDVTFCVELGLFVIGAVVAAPIYLPYFWITEKIPDKQPDIKVNYLEKNRIK